MNTVTIEYVERIGEKPYFSVQDEEHAIKTIKCFPVMKQEDYEADKALAIAYANELRNKPFEVRTKIDF
jgi:hypothetical protein